MLNRKKLINIAIALAICISHPWAAMSLHAAKEEEIPAEYQELMDIVESENTLMKRMESDLSQENLDNEIELRINLIVESYQAYIENYPSSIFGKILYAKFLRKADRSEEAQKVFLEIHDDNPDIAVVNQHLALYASENADFRTAYKHFKRAIELDPNQALFYYQLGEFIYSFKIRLMKNHILTVSEVEEQMVDAFKKAHELQPENRDFHVRWAESYFDKFNPDWNIVLGIWDELLDSTNNLFERDVLRMQKVRVLIELKKFIEAENLLKKISDPALMDAKSELMEKIQES